jgi:gluconolactonase
MATLVASAASRLPGPPELLPGKPDAILDLQTEDGVRLVGGEWRYADARVEEIDFVELAGPGAEDPLGPGDVPNRTYDVVPHAEGVEYDDSGWLALAPEETMLRLGNGRVSFNWYRISITLPERVGDTDVSGSTVVFEVVVDDYAEVWVNGELPLALGYAGGQVVRGFNAPNRVVLTRDAIPGETFQLAVFGINGPISVSPRNYIWMRTATLEVYAPGRAPVGFERPFTASSGLESIVPSDSRLEQVAGGFEFTEGPVWSPEGALLFSSPNTNVIYRWDASTGAVTVFDAKSGYTGVDTGRYGQPGSNGLTFDPEGRLVMCQHGNRRVLRVNPHGDTTVLADSYDGKRLNSPNDLVFRSDGTLYFTDPPFGLPGMADDPSRELPGGVYSVRDGVVRLETDELEGPNGLAFSPDERVLYVGDWDLTHKVVMRYGVAADGSLRNGEVFHDMTEAPDEDAIDGIKVDQAGNVYACGPGGIWVLSPAGERLGLIELPEDPHNLAFGDDGARTLYITALTGVYRIRLAVPGITPFNRPGARPEEDR